jgi:hypothetical protein
MQDHSHKLLFLGLTGLMSIAALYGSEAGPTLLVDTDGARPALSASFTRSEERASPFAAAKLAPHTANCPGSAYAPSALCAATSKIALSSP